MATAKSNRYFDGFSIRYLLLHPAIWFLAMTCLVVLSSIRLWEQHRDRIVDRDHDSLTAESVRINLPPKIYSTDLLAELQARVFNKASLSDRELVPLTAEYLGSVPWIKQINRIEKSSAGLEIDLNYRIPVALIEVASQIAAVADAEGTVFDTSLLVSIDNIDKQTELLRISMPQVMLTNSTVQQTRPTDQRVEHACRLCEFLLPILTELELYRVVTYDLPNQKPDSRPPQLELWTRNGTRVVWGSSPGHERPHESSHELKLAALREFISTNGSLTQFAARDESKIDVSMGTPQVVAAKRVASLFELLEQCK